MPAAWDLVEPIWEQIEIHEGSARFLEAFSAVPEPVGLLFAAYWTQSEIYNGGFNQFFANSTGVLAPEAVRGFRAIGQVQTAAVVQRAMERFGRVYPRGRDERFAVAESVEEFSFDDLDEEFYRYLESEQGGFENAADSYAERVTWGGAQPQSG
jgi:Domain of unknown function (DUF4375)